MAEQTNPSPPLRIAAINFLNAAPLVWGLDSDTRFVLAYTTPADCADALAQGTADLGVIPLIELARIPSVIGFDGIGVAARSEVRSILLISRGPLNRVRTLALDPASRTSSLLAQVLLRLRFQATFEVVAPAAQGDWRGRLHSGADAVLMIGDPALKLSISGTAEEEGYATSDLVREWHTWTGLPFVFALWGVRRAALPNAAKWLGQRLLRARREGGMALEDLVRLWAPRLAISEDDVRRYLTCDVEYDCGAEHWAGMERFFALAAETGLLHTSHLPELMRLTQ